MTHLPALWAKATAASAAAVIAAVGAADPSASPSVVVFLLGSGGVSLVVAVFAYGKLNGRVEAQDERHRDLQQAVKRVEEKLDKALQQLAVVSDRTGAA